MNKLPIYKAKHKIIEEIRRNETVIILGETGCGKTTQIPQFIYQNLVKSSNKKICITQPRRIAAISLAKRVSDEMQVKLGSKVGYTIRFDDCTSKSTQIQFMTDGMLLRNLLGDELLKDYSHVILDEAHERSLRTDVLFGMMKIIQEKRSGSSNPLKIIVMSATLNADKFSSFFNNAPVLYVSGRQFPVDVFYVKEPVKDIVESAVITVLQIHEQSPPGDVLVFLTGQEEIENVHRVLDSVASQVSEKTALLICPVYAALQTQQQNMVFQETPLNTRKIVLATNIAETSITIPGIKFVVDSGLAKIRGFHPKLGIESLLVQPISKSSARQRSGRAGRQTRGSCYRLYTEDTFYSHLKEDTVPEIYRSQLSHVILLLFALKINDVMTFPFLDTPPMDSLKKGVEELYSLGAITYKEGALELTSVGLRMAEFPVDPKLAKVLIKSQEIGPEATTELLMMISLLSVENIFHTPSHLNEKEREKAFEARQRFTHSSGDHLSLLSAYKAYLENGADPKWCEENYIQKRAMKQVKEIYSQLENFCGKQGIPTSAVSVNSLDHNVLLECFLAGYFKQVAFRMENGSYKTLGNNQIVSIHPSCVLVGKKPEVIMFHELTFTTKLYVRGVSVIEPFWLSRKNK